HAGTTPQFVDRRHSPSGPAAGGGPGQPTRVHRLAGRRRGAGAAGPGASADRRSRLSDGAATVASAPARPTAIDTGRLGHPGVAGHARWGPQVGEGNRPNAGVTRPLTPDAHTPAG